MSANLEDYYLENERKIPAALAKKYLKIVQYENSARPRPGGRPFYAIGMENRSGGWEIRSASSSRAFKSVLIKRDISIIENSHADGSVRVFEGMMDFLSLLTLAKKPSLKGEAVILHSVGSFGRCIEYLNQTEFSRLHLWLDNDDAGQKTAQRFEREFKGRTVNHAPRYAGFKDLNAFLINREGKGRLHLCFNIS